MIRHISLFALLVAAGCSSVRPRVVSAPAADGSLDCALSQATDRGYTVESAAAGVFFKAERPENAISVSILNASVAQGELRVAGSTEYHTDSGRRPRSASKGTTRDAEEIVAACAAHISSLAQ